MANKGRSYFYVYQNKTFIEECSGSFLWSPKYAKGYAHNAGYDTMKLVQPGDIILHSYHGEIAAIGVAKSACYSSPRPSKAFSEWSNDGWRIDVEYCVLKYGLKVAPYIPELYQIQPENGPYTAAFRGKQQYLCNANEAIFDYLLDRILRLQYKESTKQAILRFLDQNLLAVQKNTDSSGKAYENKTQNCIRQVVDGCEVEALIIDQNKKTHFTINTLKYPMQKVIIGKQVGDVFRLPNIPLTYQIEKISK